MSYTTLLGLSIPSTGTLDGTWGDTVNDSITQLVEDAIAETATADVTSSNWTLSAGVPGGANQERCAILKPTGTPGTSRDIVGPGISKAYVVVNESDGAVVVKSQPRHGLAYQDSVLRYQCHPAQTLFDVKPRREEEAILISIFAWKT